MVRQVFSQQTVTDSVAKQSANYADIGLQVATKVHNQREKSNYINNASQAQVELNTLNNKYRTDNSNSPYNNLDDYKSERDGIFEKYADNISPAYRANWFDKKAQLVAQDDISFETWATKQNAANVITDIQSVVKSDMNIANSDGMAYGSDDTNDLTSLMKYNDSIQNLDAMGDGVLTTQQSSKIKQEYSQKYLTNFVNGVIETNPLKAKELLNEKSVKSGLTNENYTKLSKAADTRFNNMSKINSENEILRSIKNGNSLVAESVNRNLSVEEIEEASKVGNLTTQAKNVLYKMNGLKPITSAKDSKESRSIIAQGGMDIRNDLTVFTSKEEKTAKDYQKMQNKIYTAMDKGYITLKQGNEMLTTFVGGYAEQYQQEMENYNQDVLKIDTNIGYAGIDKYFDEKIDASRNWFFDEDKDVQITNSNNKIKLFDMYTYSLSQEASAMGMTIDQLSQQPIETKQKVLTKSFENAKMLYASGVSGREIKDAIEADNIISDSTQKEIRVRSQATVDKAYTQPTKPVELNTEDQDFLNNL